MLNEKFREETPDLIFPSNNQYGIPVLDSNRQMIGVEMPFNRWGTIKRAKRVTATMHFYTDDYRFESLWKKPNLIIESGVKHVIEPNFSTNDCMPEIVILWNIYKKRWLARYWQEYGINIAVDLAIAPRYRELSLLGVPKGWKAYATYTYTVNYEIEWILDDYKQAIEHAETEEILFIVYGGNKAVQDMAKLYNWLWFPHSQQAYFNNVRPEKKGARNGKT